MNENENKTGSWKMILGGILLIVVLFVGIKFIFWGLEQRLSKPADRDVQSSQSVSAGTSEEDAPSFCVYCGKELPDSFRWGQFCPYCGEKVE